MEKISWTDHVRTEKVLHTAKEEKNILNAINRGWITALVTSSEGTSF
jgi:hypothetical protein